MPKVDPDKLKYTRTATPASTGGELITYTDPQESEFFNLFEKGDDAKSLRLKKVLALPDLTRKENSPLKFIMDRIAGLEVFKGLDIVSIPETLPTEVNFDWFDFPLDHPSRKETDTYFITPERVFRTQTTASWAYYFTDPTVLKRLEEQGHAGLLCYGKVYRKDEIDRHHYPVFHQVDGLYLSRKDQQTIDLKFLQNVIVEVIKGVFGSTIEYRFLDDNFPYTDPSTQTEIKWNDQWLEILGAGIVRDSVLHNFGLDPEKYNGWAFGFGLERLALIKMHIPDIRILWSNDPRITQQFTNIDSEYREVSKYPPAPRDISFILGKAISLNKFYEIVRDSGGDLVEEVKLIDEYEDDAKFGADNKSYTFRIIYRSPERTLTNEEVNTIHSRIADLTHQELNAEIR